MGERLYTWTSESIHVRVNTYKGEKYILGRANTYMCERIHTWVSKYIHVRANTCMGE